MSAVSTGAPRSLNAAIAQRTALIDQINDSIKSLNENFRKDPSKIDSATIQKLITDLTQVNQEINQQIIKNSKPDSKCCNWLSPTTVMLACANLFFMSASAATSIVNLVVQDEWYNQINNSDLNYATTNAANIANLVVVAVGSIFTGVICNLVQNAMQDRDQFKMVLEIAELKESGEQNFDSFLRAFNEYKTSNQQNLDEQNARLKECVNKLDQLPANGYKAQIPTRDEWVTSLIHMLPESHPLKIQINQLHKTAMQLFNAEQSDLDQDESTASTTPSKQIINKGKAVAKSPKAQVLTSSSSDSGNLRYRHNFQGESLPQNQLEISRSNQTDTSRNNLTGQKKQYINDWKRLEKVAGFSLGRLNYGDHIVSVNGYAPNSLTSFESRVIN